MSSKMKTSNDGAIAASLTEGEAGRVYEALSRLDVARRSVATASCTLRAVVLRERHNRVREAFDQFIAAGGATSKDWSIFIEGGQLRGCVRRKGNLRLLVDYKPHRSGRHSATGSGAA